MSKRLAQYPKLSESEAQLFGSRKYVPFQIRVIPHNGEWLLATSYGTHLGVPRRLTDDQLHEFLRESYGDQLQLSEAERIKHVPRPLPEVKLDFDPLAGLTIKL